MTETRYAGVRFSTLLHARWALTFEDLHVPWSYRPASIHLSAGSTYQPDFWLPRQRIWMQAPGDHASTPDYRRWREFAAAAQHNEHCAARDHFTPGMRCEAHGQHAIAPMVNNDWEARLVLYSIGEIPAPQQMTASGPADNSQQSMLTLIAGNYQWTRCADCGQVEAAPYGLVDDLTCRHPQPDGGQPRADDPCLMMAYDLARKAVTATFHGRRCPYCDDRIAIGDLIGAGRPIRRYRWYHAGCLLDSRRDRR